MSSTKIHLRPILFLLCINDISLAFEFETILFADDAYYLTSVDKHLTSLENGLNNQLKFFNF